VRSHPLRGAGAGDVIGSIALPAGTRRVGVVLRGTDTAGEPLVVVQEQSLK
jgi:hypothetical protein